MDAEDPLWTQTQREFPILQQHDIRYTRTKGGPGDPGLESWPPEEPGPPESPRPKDLPLGTFGVEVRHDAVRPLDVMGDIVSHHLIETDPVVKQTYQNFEQSLTPQQRARMQEQYQHARTQYGETRPYQDWHAAAGLPAYFRGYAFNQWERPEELYTPAQMQSFDRMMTHLRTPPSPAMNPKAPIRGGQFSGR